MLGRDFLPTMSTLALIGCFHCTEPYQSPKYIAYKQVMQTRRGRVDLLLIVSIPLIAALYGLTKRTTQVLEQSEFTSSLLDDFPRLITAVETSLRKEYVEVSNDSTIKQFQDELPHTRCCNICKVLLFSQVEEWIIAHTRYLG